MLLLSRLQRRLKYPSLTAAAISWLKKSWNSITFRLAFRQRSIRNQSRSLTCKTIASISMLAGICTEISRTLSMQKPSLTAVIAVADIPDGASILIGGFGVLQGWPHEL